MRGHVFVLVFINSSLVKRQITIENRHKSNDHLDTMEKCVCVCVCVCARTCVLECVVMNAGNKMDLGVCECLGVCW